MELFDPTTSHEREAIQYAPRPEVLKGLRVGLVENTKFNSDVLLMKIAGRLKDRHGVEFTKLVRKKSASHAVDPEMIEEFKTRADFVIAGVGD